MGQSNKIHLTGGLRAYSGCSRIAERQEGKMFANGDAANEIRKEVRRQLAECAAAIEGEDLANAVLCLEEAVRKLSVSPTVSPKPYRRFPARR